MRVFVSLLAVVLLEPGCAEKVTVIYSGSTGMTSAEVSPEEARLMNGRVRDAPEGPQGAVCDYWEHAIAATPSGFDHARIQAEAGARVGSSVPCRLPDYFHMPAAKADALIAHELAGYAATGEPWNGRVEDLVPVVRPYALERGSCFRLLYRFGDDVAPSEELAAEPGIDAREVTGAHWSAGVMLRGHAATIDLGCPQRHADVVLRFQHKSSLGTGSYTAQLFVKPISEAELQREAATNADAMRAGQQQRAQLHQAGCAECLQAAGSCGREIDRYIMGQQQPSAGEPPTVDQCVGEYLSCLHAREIAPQECGRAVSE